MIDKIFERIAEEREWIVSARESATTVLGKAAMDFELIGLDCAVLAIKEVVLENDERYSSN